MQGQNPQPVKNANKKELLLYIGDWIIFVGNLFFKLLYTNVEMPQGHQKATTRESPGPRNSKKQNYRGKKQVPKSYEQVSYLSHKIIIQQDVAGFYISMAKRRITIKMEILLQM